MLRMPLDSPFIISLHRSLRMLTVRYATLPAACETTSMNQRLAHQKIDLWSQSHFLGPILWSFLLFIFCWIPNSFFVLVSGFTENKKRRKGNAVWTKFTRFANRISLSFHLFLAQLTYRNVWAGLKKKKEKKDRNWPKVIQFWPQI